MDAQAREILARALRLEHLRSAGLSVVDLRSAAAEVGVSEVSLQNALAEFEQDRAAKAGSAGRMLGLAVRYGMGGAAIGIAGEAVLAPVTGHSSLSWALYGAVGALMVTGALAAARSRFGRVIGFFEFQVRNAGLWLGFGVSTLVAAHTVAVKTRRRTSGA